jgi:hypothetical protein
LRKANAPLDPANRRISLIVQYIIKNNGDDDAPEAGDKPAGESEKAAGKER